MRCVFFGTPLFAATVLRHLLESSVHEIVAIVSKPDKPQGRQQKILPTEVKIVRDALAPHIPLYQPPKASDPQFIEELKALGADLFIVVAYGEIVKKSVLDIPKFGCINTHGSLLPYYRGAAPMQRSLLDGVLETGITIMRMDIGLDSGDVLLMKKCTVPSDMNLGELSTRLQSLSCEGLDEALEQISAGTAHFVPQEHSLATFAPKVGKEESLLNWTENAKTLHNRVRAFSPIPGAWTYVYLKGEAKRLKIFESEVIPLEGIEPGDLLVVDNQLVVGTAEGGLVIKRLQMEGKSQVSGSEFLRGYSAQGLSFIRL